MSTFDFSSKKTEQEELASFLGGHNKPMTVEGIQPSQPVAPQPVTSIPDQNAFDEYAKKYYTRGAKKGQLKPVKQVRTPLQPTQVQTTQPAPATINSPLISGFLFLTLVDMLIPMLIVFVNNRVDPKHKVEAKMLQLTKEQKQALEPVANELVKMVQITGDPRIILPLAMLGMYGMNLMMVKAFQK